MSDLFSGAVRGYDLTVEVYGPDVDGNRNPVLVLSGEQGQRLIITDPFPQLLADIDKVRELVEERMTQTDVPW